MSKKKGEKHYMATQIAPTPTLRGNEAKQVLRETHIKTDRDAQNGARKLSVMFSTLVKK